MKLRRHIHPLLATILLVAVYQTSQAQPGFTVDIAKPKPFEERLLKAEKTKEGKLKAPRRIFQNITTHYNYVFNATNKFKEVIERAKAVYKEDYSQLLSFYNYSLDGTAADSAQLDSVIYKARTGIVNHDLRSEWLDELYLLWGASFRLEKKLDSAYLMFQFINYAYAPQEDDGFYKYIGTNTDGAQELSIATKEKKQFLHSNTFARNNAFIWQIRTLIELGNYTASGSLISTLRRDPVFPKRLGDDLDEMEAYWYYKQGRWDSTLAHLLPVIDAADTKRERARWYYLAAQLMERTGKPGEAEKLYTKAISTTPDPVLEVYSRLNLVRINKEGGENAVDKNVAELVKMAKRDKYEDYRDIIYYMAAQMEMQNNNIAAAQDLLMKGARYNNGNLASRSKAFLQIADVSFDQKKYIQAGSFYDSIQTADIAETEAQRVTQRKPPLKKITDYSGVIYRQDSLQRIAALPLAERDAFIKNLVKQLRKQVGLKDEGTATGGTSSIGNNPATELFSTQPKGEWYFYNTSSRAQGTAAFKQLWGNRPNVDNWRRYAVVSQQLLAQNPMNTRDAKEGITPLEVTDNNPTSEGLLAKLPFTAEAIKASNDSIKKALFGLGTAYLNEVEDYPSAIATFEELRKRFPDAEKMDEVLFDLYYAYTKSGNASQAAQIKKALQDKYPASRYAGIVTTGKDPEAKVTVSPQATKAYENVYNLYIEGKFDAAESAKKQADSTYKTTFWQPQLLYIEAVYDIKQRNDSNAKKVLQTIVAQNTNKGLTTKAQNLLNVLARRRQIEDELNRYQMQNGTIDTTKKFVDITARRPAIVVSKPVVPPVKKDSVTVKPPVQKNLDTVVKKPVQKTKDSLLKKPVVIKPVDTLVKKQPVLPKSNSIYTYVPEAPHYAVVILDKVDQVFAGEAKNAFFRYNREKYYNQPLDAQNLTLNTDTKLLLIGPFATAQAAIDYALRAKQLAPTDIVPWLTGNKYTFSIISAPNLELLKTATDFSVYKKFLEVYVPGKF